MVNFVVFLIESMRQRMDAEYTEILRRMGWGTFTDDDLALLNTRVFYPLRVVVSGASMSSQPGLWYRPFVVATNRLRCAINNCMTFEIARRHKSLVYEFDA